MSPNSNRHFDEVRGEIFYFRHYLEDLSSMNPSGFSFRYPPFQNDIGF